MVVTQTRSDLRQQRRARLIDAFIDRALVRIGERERRIGCTRLGVDLHQILGLHQRGHAGPCERRGEQVQSDTFTHGR
jgi:hypothetical protein